MKQYLIIAAVFAGAAILFSCKQSVKQNEVKSESKIQPIQPPSKSISVELKGTLRTRRSYSNIQFMDNEKEIHDYLKKQRKTNPELEAVLKKDDSIWVNEFKKFGLIENYTFLVKKFKAKTKNINCLITMSGDTVKFKMHADTVHKRMFFSVFFKNDFLEVNTNNYIYGNDFSYTFLDLITGGNKELVILDEYYVMNGDNFDFQIYEIKILTP